MQRLISICCFIGLVSCGAKKMAVNPEINTIYSPELNKISYSEIGISLISKEKGYTYDAIEITKEFEVKLHDILETIEVGEIFINDHSIKEYDLYSNSSTRSFGLALAKNSKVAKIYTTSDNDGIYKSGFSENGINLINHEKEIEYLKTKVIVKEKEYFKQEFIYNGRVGSAIKLIYREYINDYARPAFTQDLQYDLSESQIIGFRGLRIQIINASNTNIEYVVLSYFDK